MTALPHDSADRPLPLVRRFDPARRRLISVRDLCRETDLTSATVRRWLAVPGAPDPVALTAEPWYGSREPLYDRADLLRFIHSDALARKHHAATARLTPAPRLIGTKTPTAGKGYVWRDPKRWRG